MSWCSVIFGLCQMTLMLTVIQQGQATFDCANSYSDGATTCSYNGVTFYCGRGLDCCENACCYEGPTSLMFSTGEAIGLGLCVSALVMTGILTLVICGATYCSDKEDTSVIFIRKR